MKKLVLGIGLCFALSCSALNAKETTHKTSNETVYKTAYDTVNDTVSDTEYNQAQLAQMLAPVALYPDSLLTHILIASTYTIEVVEAARWITKNKKLSTTKIANKLEDKDWEPSIKALVMFPDVLERLSDDLSWTQQLGDAFLQSEENVLQAIQDLRYQAEQAGSLDKMENVSVSRDDNNIIIQPIQKEVIYVPYYDSRYVYGNWHWTLYPPIHWGRGLHVGYSHHRPFSWNAGIHISWNYFFSDFHWHNRHVVVVNHRNTRHYRTKKKFVRSGYANRWIHKPHHRRGVSYSNKYVNKRFNGHRPVVYKTNTHKQKLYKNSSHINNKKVQGKGNNSRIHYVNKHEVLKRKFKTQHKFPYKKVESRHLKTQPKMANHSKSHGNNRIEKRVVKTIEYTQPTKKIKVVNKQTRVQKTVQKKSKPQKKQRSHVRSVNIKKQHYAKHQTK
jgi:hypothetical protein